MSRASPKSRDDAAAHRAARISPPDVPRPHRRVRRAPSRHADRRGAGREGVTLIGTATQVVDDSGLVVHAHTVYDDLAGYDLLFLPGGVGTRTLMHDTRFLQYLATWGETRPVASVCTGSLLLGAAGYLKGLRATTHHNALDTLKPLCREVIADRRIVDEGRVVTAGGVASSLDLGLYLVEKYWGAGAREAIAAQMEYTAYRAN
jgi:transcriptional regulator GlxA family with amidase domain